MSDLLVRNLPESTKRALAVRAAENGRSLSAEAAAILDEALCPPGKTWFELLYDLGQDLDGVELPLPERHPARETSFE